MNDKADDRSGFRLAYKFRIYPTPEQEEYFELNFRATRFVYNHFLSARIKAYKITLPTLRDGSPNPEYDSDARPLSLFDTTKQLVSFKREALDQDGKPWLVKADSAALVYALRHLDKAYQNFFRRVKTGGKPGFPKYKSAGDSRQSYTTDTRCKILDGRHIFLPKAGAVRAKVHREVEGEIVSATVSRNAAGQYHVSISVREAKFAPLPERDAAVGVALGVRTWAATSDGVVYDYPSQIESLKKKLAREQRKLASKQRGSSNYHKQKVKVARIYLRISNAKSYSMHALTRSIVDNYGVVVSQGVRVSDMMQKVKADADLPQKVKKRINGPLHDASLAEINEQLEYKCKWAGRMFVMVPADATLSQVCTSCEYGHISQVSELCDARTCPKRPMFGGSKHDAAKNVLKAGLDILREDERFSDTAETLTEKKTFEERRSKGGEGNHR